MATLTADQVRDSAFTMVALSAVAYAEARLALGRIFSSALEHGLSLPEIAEASGRTEAFITELLDEVG